MPFVPVVISGPEGEVTTYAFLDEGATSTFIDVQIAEAVGLKGKRDPVTITMFKNKQETLEESERVTFTIRGTYPGAKENVVKGARTTDGIGASAQSLNFPKLVEKYGYLEGLPVCSYGNVTPMVLIGQPDKLLSLARKSVHRGSRDPVAYKTWLGWAISGKYKKEHANESMHLIQDKED